MKTTNYALAILLILFVRHLNAQQWSTIASPSNMNNLFLCHSFSEDACIVTGSAGEIHKTTDGGMTFQTAATIFDFGEWFNDMDFPSDDVGYVCGGTAFGNHRNFIAKTTDGGITWDSLIANEYPGHNFVQLDFWNENIGFVIGEGNLFLKTIDGGETFTEIILPAQNNYTMNGIYFNSEEIAYAAITVVTTAAVKKHEIYKTENGGLDWVSVYTNAVDDFNIESDNTIHDINFYNNNTGYACGFNGFFLKTIDGGLNWTEQNLADDTTTLRKIEIIDNETLYIISDFAYGGGFRKTFKSTDGGNTWGRLEHEFGDISFSEKGYATNKEGVLLKTDFLIPNENLNPEINIKIYPSLIQDIINIEIPNVLQGGRLNIVNETGIRINILELENVLNQQFDLSFLSTGFYFVEIMDKKGAVLHVSKVMKK